MELIKQIANRYDIISLIGQGGMADVFKAKDIIPVSYTHLTLPTT